MIRLDFLFFTTRPKSWRGAGYTSAQRWRSLPHKRGHARATLAPFTTQNTMGTRKENQWAVWSFNWVLSVHSGHNRWPSSVSHVSHVPPKSTYLFQNVWNSVCLGTSNPKYTIEKNWSDWVAYIAIRTRNSVHLHIHKIIAWSSVVFKDVKCLELTATCGPSVKYFLTMSTQNEAGSLSSCWRCGISFKNKENCGMDKINTAKHKHQFQNFPSQRRINRGT